MKRIERDGTPFAFSVLDPLQFANADVLGPNSLGTRQTTRQPERDPANPEVRVMQVCVTAATQQSLRVSMKVTEVIFVLK